jgi:hypothetical protein
MFLSHASGPDDVQLVQYLLGLLGVEETEWIDELTIADDDVAWRLRDAENDLVDAYARGVLDENLLEPFQRFYLSSPLRREKLKFARSFVPNADAAPVTAQIEATPEVAPVAVSVPVRAARPVRQVRAASQGSRWYDWLLPQSRSGWGMAATAAALLLVSGVLLMQDVRQRRHSLFEMQSAKAALDSRSEQLERQLTDQRAAHDDAARELARARAAQAELARRSTAVPAPVPPATPVAANPPADSPAPAARSLATVALVLWPQTRDATSLPAVVLPPGTKRLVLAVRIESNDFPGYQAILKDPATDRTVWRSGTLAVRTGGELTVPVTIPANLLKPQHYSLQLAARGATVNGEIIGSYAFRVQPR